MSMRLIDWLALTYRGTRREPDPEGDPNPPPEWRDDAAMLEWVAFELSIHSDLPEISVDLTPESEEERAVRIFSHSRNTEPLAAILAEGRASPELQQQIAAWLRAGAFAARKSEADKANDPLQMAADDVGRISAALRRHPQRPRKVRERAFDLAALMFDVDPEQVRHRYSRGNKRRSPQSR